MKKRLIALLLALVFVFALAACGTNNQPAETTPSETTPTETEPAATVDSPVAGMKIAYILKLSSSDIFELFAARVKEVAAKLGMEADVFFCNASDTTFQDTISTCAASGYDGLLLSHGDQTYSYTFITGILQQYPDLKIVCFDTQFYDNEGNKHEIPGVTQYFQEDAGLARVLLDQICALYPDKVEAGEPINIIKVWKGPNFNSPFDRRQVGYVEYEENGLINTLETIGPTDDTNGEASTCDVMAATLQKYQPGDIDAVWVTYDEYGRGVYKAITENGWNLPMVSVDICNTDIGYMKENPGIWVACGCTDFAMNGEIGVRILALELANQYEDIYDPVSGQKGVDWVEVPASAITAASLKPDTTLENLYDVADASYGNTDYLSTCDWLVSCIGY